MWKHLHEVLDKLSALGLVINKKAQKGEEQGSSLVNARVSRPEADPETQTRASPWLTFVDFVAAPTRRWQALTRPCARPCSRPHMSDLLCPSRPKFHGAAAPRLSGWGATASPRLLPPAPGSTRAGLGLHHGGRTPSDQTRHTCLQDSPLPWDVLL